MFSRKAAQASNQSAAASSACEYLEFQTEFTLPSPFFRPPPLLFLSPTSLHTFSPLCCRIWFLLLLGCFKPLALSTNPVRTSSLTCRRGLRELWAAVFFLAWTALFSSSLHLIYHQKALNPAFNTSAKKHRGSN